MSEHDEVRSVEIYTCDHCGQPYTAPAPRPGTRPTRLCDGCFCELMRKIDNPRLLDSVLHGPLISKRVAEVLARISFEGEYEQWESSTYGCFMLRNRMRSWCGYVSVPAGHPWYLLGYGDRVTPVGNYEGPTMSEIAPALLPALVEALSGKEDGMLPIDLAVRVHGGVTFSDCRGGLPRQDADDKRWTFGFDCAHSGDLLPGTALLFSPQDYDRLFKDEVYRDRDYVFAETSRLAAQLREVEKRGYR